MQELAYHLVCGIIVLLHDIAICGSFTVIICMIVCLFTSAGCSGGFGSDLMSGFLVQLGVIPILVRSDPVTVVNMLPVLDGPVGYFYMSYCVILPQSIQGCLFGRWHYA